MTISKEQRDLTKDLVEYLHTFHSRRCVECKTPLQDCDNCLASGIVSEVLADRCYLIPELVDKERYLSRTPVKPVLPIVREE